MRNRYNLRVAPPHENLSDQELIAAANRGDAAAFEALYLRYRDWVVLAAMRFTRDHAAALDVMQDTFMYLLKKLPGFELTSQFKTFLYPVVRHNALASVKKARHWDDIDSIAPQSKPAAEQPAEVAALHAAVESLDAGHREVLILRIVDDLSLQETALAMGLPIGTVKSRLHNALETLRGKPGLKNFFENP